MCRASFRKKASQSFENYRLCMEMYGRPSPPKIQKRSNGNKLERFGLAVRDETA